jgi:bacitracin synthase 3
MLKDLKVQRIYPLSPMQEGMLFHTIINKDAHAYFEQMSYDIQGEIDLSIFESIWNALIEKYDVFRTIFVYEEINRPMQVVLQERKTKLFFEDISAMTDSARERYLEEFKVRDIQTGFNLSKDIMIRVAVFKTGPDKHKVIWSHHHILMDGWSLGVVVNDFFSIYRTIKANRLLQLKERCPYFTYIKWLEKQNQEDGYTYWQEYLAGYEQLASLPGKTSPGKHGIYQQKKLEIKLDRDTSAKLADIARQNQVTINTVFQSIWGILLQRYNNTQDVVFGTVVSGRPSQIPGIESAVGLFINTIPIRIQNGDAQTFGELLRRVQDAALLSDKYSYLSLAQVQSNSELKNELMNHIMVFENYPLDREKLNQSFTEFQVDNVEFFEQTNYDFNIIIMPGDECYIDFKHNPAIYPEALIAMVKTHFINIIRQIVAQPDLKLAELIILTAEEQDRVFTEFNNTQADYPKSQTIHQLFEAQVEKSPDRTAVIYQDRQLSYREFNIKANQLARMLRSIGVGSDTIVGLMVERSLEMMIGIMGILKAGGAYLPIDPNYPAERIQYMLENSGTQLLLTQDKFTGMVSFSGEVVSLEAADLYKGDGTNLKLACGPRNLAYVIYTSGSTGRPKGAMIEHYSVINRLNWMQKQYPLGSSDAILQKTPYTFDVSVWELLWWSLVGAKVCFLIPGGEKDPEAIGVAIEKHRITTMHFVPSMLATFLESVDNLKMSPKLKSLTRVFASGEALSLPLTKRFNHLLYQTNHTMLINLYGPTEATVDVSYFDCSPHVALNTVPIGKPIDNIHLYVLDQSQNIQPVGIPGELYIAGDGLARGYLHQPELTAAKFVANPFIPGTRMYRTGDLAQWLPDGNIEFLGRIDHQVKIRGNRIELGEIENRLLEHELIKEAVAIDRSDAGGTKYLCAYIVAMDELKVPELREYLLQKLPEYMVPSYFVKLDKMPLTPNGKIDRKALPNPEGRISSDREYAAPTNDLERKLVQIWQDILGVEKIGINDNFFELGGHSLKATIFIAKIHKELQVNFPLKDVFTISTIQAQAKYISRSEQSRYSAIQPVVQREYYPVSSAQKRMYLLWQLEGESITYNILGAVIIEGRVDKDQIESWFQQLIARHETLRTSFELVGEEPVQRIHSEVEFAVEYLELPEIEAESEQLERIISGFIRPFNLEQAPLIRIKLARLNNEKHLLFIEIHHFISDGVSMGIILKELAELSQNRELPPLRIQYKDFTVWQNELFRSDEVKKQEEYWLNVFKGEIPVLNMPTDYPRPTVQSFEGNSINFEIEVSETKKLNQLAVETGATMYMILLAAYNILFAKYTGQEDIIVGSPIASRPHVDLQNIVGMFVNTLAMRNYPEGDKTFREFLEEVKENALAAYENQDYQFEELIGQLNIRRDLSRNPLFDTMFVLQNMDNQELSMEELKITSQPIKNIIAKFDLTLTAVETGDKVKFDMEYCTKLYKAETVARIVRHYIRVIKEITENPQRKLKEIDILTETEKNQILHEFNNTQVDYPKDKTIQEFFEEQVEKTPGKVALVYEEQQITYQELNKKANQLARVLIENGITPNTIVAIMVERSFEMIVGILAILKSGGAYLPIDCEYPFERIDYMLKDSNAKILLTQSNLIKFDGLIINLEKDDLYQGENSNLCRTNNPEDLAYIIYTSGSTGRPKGVMVPHRSLVNVLCELQKEYPLMENDVYLLKTTYTFDVSVTELFGWIFGIGRLAILPKGMEKDPHAIVEAIDRYNVTHINFVPSMLKIFLNVLSKNDHIIINRLKYVFTAGEALSREIVKEFHEITQKVKLENLYGPTETTIYATKYSLAKYDLKGNNSIPIGKPLSNINAYIVDKEKSLQPIGIPGELCISGECLAKGYLNQSGLTAEKFITNSFIPGTKMYRTGDLARWLPDGNIEFLGRMDHQVKIRGFRIELGEIENRLLEHDRIKATVVIDRNDNQGNNYLCAYIVTTNELNITELREYLLKKLPDYMVPSYFVKLDKIPLTSSGKTDRKALPEPDGSIASNKEYVAPANEMEETLTSIWQSVLGNPKIGVRDNFFELGGDSIKAIQVAARLNKYQLTMDIKDLFKNPTIEQLAKNIKYDVKEINQEDVSGEIGLTSVQKWFFESENIDRHHFNQSVMLYRKEGFDENFVRQTFNKILEHHDALRMVYHTEGQRAIQYNRPIGGTLYDLKVIDVTNEIDYVEKVEEASNQLQKRIDLANGPLVKLGLFKTKDGDHLLIIIHHLVIDGVSWRILMEDFTLGYQSLLQMEEIKLAPKTHSYKEWSNQLQQYSNRKEFLKEIEYWQKLENQDIVPLPKNTSGNNQRPVVRQKLTFKLPATETEKLLKQVNGAYNTEINDILLTALGLAVNQCTRQGKVLIQMEGHGREEIIPGMNITRTIGWFTSIYPVILDMTGAKDISYIIKQTKESLRRIPSHGVGYGILKYLSAPENKQGIEFRLNPEIRFNYLGQFAQNIDQSHILVPSKLPMGLQISPMLDKLIMPIEINGMIMDDQLLFSFDFNAAEYQEETVAELLENFKVMLLEIIKHCMSKEVSEFTPADFQDTDLSIEELDDISKLVEEI